MFRFLLLAAACALPAFAHAADRPAASVGDGGVSAFYAWTSSVPTTPGLLLRHEPLPAAHRVAHAAVAERVLYSSTDGIDGKAPVAVSGVLYLPTGARPRGGWPLLSWAHGTTGAANVCAPSWMTPPMSRLQLIDAWLARGYAVVATDYQGLGVPGPHPYLLYRPEAYGVLDIARAALHAYPRTLSNRVIVGGHSQGSGAALGAALLAPDYAPELQILGTVATGLVAQARDPGDAPQLPPHEWGSDYDAVDAAFVMLFLIGDATAMHPGLDPHQYVTAAGRPLLASAQRGCLPEMVELSTRLQLSIDKAYTPAYPALIDEIVERGQFPAVHLKQPVFTVTGLADHDAPPSMQYNFISAMCHAGTRVDWHYYPGETHNGAVLTSLPDALAFADRRLAGDVGSDRCAALQTPQADAGTSTLGDVP
ncbi:lipase family protein [Solimonas flava]|uniref:lipase family protein n=1 Tax=Solimonas flava TaxID=415849 RepID=UPI0004180019|nr:lipase family protein [Solimonas flava]